MDRFWSFLGAAIVLVVLIGLASITIIGGILLATIWLYVFPIMVDRRVGLGEAMRMSKDLVVKAGFWEHLALVILLLVLGSIGGPVTLRDHALHHRGDHGRLLPGRRQGRAGREELATKLRTRAARPRKRAGRGG